MAGPFANKTGINVDEAIASGLEASGVAPQTSVPTASTPGIPDAGNPLAAPNTQTGRGGMQMPQFQGPEWAWRPVQEDFGQVDVRRGQYDTGVVPTVNVQLPFAALANRQQATAQKRAALDKKVADFDLYAGIGKAPDPYMPAFGKLARGGMNQFVQEIADALYSGDTAQATRAIATDPELNNRWRARAAEYNELGTNGQYWFDQALAYKEAYEADPTDKDPEDYQQALRVLQGIGEFGGANGPDIESLAKSGRTFEATASRQALFNNMKPVLELAMQELQAAGTISREMGNMIGLRETNVKSYDELIDRMSNDWYRSGIGESAEDNKKWLKARLGESKVTETTLRGVNFAPQRSGSGSGSTPPPAGALTVDYARLPKEAFDVKRKTASGEERTTNLLVERGADLDMEYPTMAIFDVTSGQGKTAQPRLFSSPDKGGSRIYVIPEGITDINGKRFIFGKQAGERGAGKMSDGSDSFNFGEEGSIQEFKSLKPVVIPYEGNEGRLESYFPWLSPQNIEEQFRGKKPRKMGGAPAKGAPKELTYNPATGEFE